MALSRSAERKLGESLKEKADQTVREAIRERGGTESNVRYVGHWADKTLGETAEAAAKGDQQAETAIKVVKQAKKKGEEH